jgi:hypothetical protein
MLKERRALGLFGVNEPWIGGFDLKLVGFEAKI